jgi:serine phosphatase RsbU (regulator of sigma subunit)
VLLDLGLPDTQGSTGCAGCWPPATARRSACSPASATTTSGAAAVAEGAQDYLIKGQVDGTLLARSIRYAVERKRADDNARRLQQVELEQRESARLERGLLPHPLLRTSAVRVHTFYQSGRRAQLGGDFYDVVQTGPDRVAMMVGDVCGHGVDAAALGVELRVAWRALMLAKVDDDAGAAGDGAGAHQRAQGRGGVRHAGHGHGVAGPARGRVRLAGHPPPLLLSSGSVVTVPTHHGPVLGVFDDAQRPASRFPLTGSDWALLLYTDGLIEGRTGADDRRMDITGLHTLIAKAQAEQVTHDRLPGWLAQQAEEANEGPLADDVAMLLLTTAEADA